MSDVAASETRNGIVEPACRDLCGKGQSLHGLWNAQSGASRLCEGQSNQMAKAQTFWLGG